MAVEGVALETAAQGKDIALKRRQRSSSIEFPNPQTSFETPRPSSVSTPRTSVSSSVRGTPKPSKYVSKMAKARDEKKREDGAATAVSSNGDKPMTSSDLETSSIPSTGSGTQSEKSQGHEDKVANLPKFGEWNKHSANSGPCYTTLFQNVAQEKKAGGPIRVRGSRSADSGPGEDLYGYQHDSALNKHKKKTSRGFLSCFKASVSP